MWQVSRSLLKPPLTFDAEHHNMWFLNIAGCIEQQGLCLLTVRLSTASCAGSTTACDLASPGVLLGMFRDCQCAGKAQPEVLPGQH